MVLSEATMKMVASSRVIIFGVGGVGSWCAESLVRSGFINVAIVDSDIVCATNINRQVQATSATIGNPKVEELRKRLLEINPSADVKAFNIPYDETTASDFSLGEYDYVIDAIDSLSSKVLLIKKSLEAGICFFSSMGAAARIDPTRIKVDTMDHTRNCPLARNVRNRLRKEKVPLNFICVYSDETPIPPASESVCGTDSCACSEDRSAFCGKNDVEIVDWCSRKKQINGSIAHITAIFGFYLAGLVIQDIHSKKPA